MQGFGVVWECWKKQKKGYKQGLQRVTGRAVEQGLLLLEALVSLCKNFSFYFEQTAKPWKEECRGVT